MFYGWRIVAVTFLTHFISVGFVFYSFGAFFKPLAAEFGASRFEIAVGMQLMMVVTAVFSPFLGRWLDRGSIRTIMCAGAVVMAAGFALLAGVSSLWQFYALLASLLALGSAMLGGLAGSTLVANWFADQRGTALGVSTMGISFSGFAMAPIATWMIASLGWRISFLVFAAVSLAAILPAVWFVVVNRPEDLGLLPDGHPHDPAAPEPEVPVLPLAPGDQIIDHPAHVEWSSRAAMRDPNFWVIAMTVALNFCANGAILTHIIPHATDVGYAPLRAASVLSAIAGVGVVGKVLFGWIVDRISKRAALWLATGLQAVGVALILSSASFPALVVAGGVFGLGMGGLVPLWGALVGAAFGRLAFGRVMGLMSPVMVPIQMLGSPFAGLMFDRTGSYTMAFAILASVYVLAMVVLALLRLPEFEPGRERAPGAGRDRIPGARAKVSRAT
jgi:MFS family permease